MSEAGQVRLSVEIEGLDDPRVADFELREALSRPFDLRVDLVAPPDTDAASLLGKDLVLVIARERASREERVVGLVTGIRGLGPERTGGGSEGRDTRLSLRVQPALALLGLRRNSRIFQEKSVPEIVQAVLDEDLGPYGRSATMSLEGTYEPREYCVQYEESDLDFVHRLLEEEGIHYRFDHAGDKEAIEIADRNTSFTDLGTLPFASHDLSIQDEECVRRFNPAKRASITHVQLRDFNFLTAAAPIGDEDGAEDADFAGERREYDHGIDRKMTAALLKARATARHRAHVVNGAERRGVAQALSIRPGRIFELSGCPLVGADGRYLVTEVTADTHAPDPDTDRSSDRSSASHEGFSARFTCIPADLPFAPARRTPRPVIEGIETAKVVGPAGEEIHPDEHARVKVQFPWDREAAGDETSSCWLRVEQPWAGKEWGWIFIPRVGMEVVVQFVDGNPDRPLVTGCLYNGENLAPYPLPDEKTKSTFKTQSSPGGSGFNEFRFEDKAGQEQIYTHAQKDLDEVVLACHTTDVGHDQTNTVDGDQTQTIDIDQKETVTGDQTMTVKSHRTVHVKGNFDEKIDGGETRTVIGGSKETYDSSETRTVLGGVKETVLGPESHTVGGAKVEVILGGQKQFVIGAASETVSSTSATQITGATNVITGASARWNGTSGVTLTAASAANLISPPSLNVLCTTLNDNCSIYTQMGTASISIGVQKGESVGSKSDTVLGKIDLYHTSVSAWGAKAAATGIKASKSGTKIELVGILFYQGTFKETTFDIDLTL